MLFPLVKPSIVNQPGSSIDICFSLFELSLLRVELELIFYCLRLKMKALGLFDLTLHIEAVTGGLVAHQLEQYT